MIIGMGRVFLRPFPALEDQARLLVYYIKRVTQNKPLYSETNSPIGYADTPDIIAPQFLIDISQLVRNDWQTGIHRVVRSILVQVFNNPPPGKCIKAVYANDNGELVYANEFMQRFFGVDAGHTTDVPVTIRNGDIYYSPDFYLNFPFARLLMLRDQGLRCLFTIYDIIPLRFPSFYWRADVLAFQAWFNGVLKVADGIICDSYSVAEDIGIWLQENPESRTNALSIGYFHLGSNLVASKPTTGLSHDALYGIQATSQRPTFLMVGTIEPRKGHEQALMAMEHLWQDGIDYNLIIIGKEGWKSYAVASYIRKHPERNKRLFWLEGISDEALDQFYSRSTALLALSLAEGFGLPLIEAAKHKLPIIARDIPVFREVAGKCAYYFSGLSSESLAACLCDWINLKQSSLIPGCHGLGELTWEQSVKQLMDVILGNLWYAEWSPHDSKIIRKEQYYASANNSTVS